MCKYYRTIILICILTMSTYLFTACAKSTSTTTTKFAIYFVKAESKENALSYGRDDNGVYVKTNVSIDSLVIEDTPILTEKDIKKYNWSTHQIQLTEEYLKKHKSGLEKESTLPETGSNIIGAKEFDAVLMTVNGKRIYCAGFPFSPMNSCFPPEYMIRDVSKDTISIIKNGDKSPKDLRQNKEIYKVLKEIGVLVE